MKTIQFEISDQQFDALKNLSQERGKSVSEIVNIAIEQILPYQPDNDIDKVLKEIGSAAGIWANRDDIGETVEYVRNLRKGTAERMRRIGIWKDDKSN